MTNLNQIARTATAAFGALLLSAACIAAAVGPATEGVAGTTATYAAAQTSASDQAQG